MATITEWKPTKDGCKQYRIYVSRGRSNGKVSMLWTAPGGWSKRSIDRAVKKVAAEFEMKVKAGEIVTKKDKEEEKQRAEAEAAKIQTLRQFGEQVFMPTMTVSCSENSRSSYQGNLDRYIYPALGAFKLPNISSNQITAMLLKLQMPRDGKRPLKHASIIKVYQITSQIFKMAYLNHTIEKNPMDFVQRPKPSKTEKLGQEPKSFSVEEMNRIFACLENEPLKWQAYIRLSADTGARRGEICGLQWSDIDFKENCITIRRNLCYTPKAGVYIDTPKSGKERAVYVSNDVLELLKRLRAEQLSGDIIPLSDFVFTQDGKVETL